MGKELDIKDLGFNTLVQLLERVAGVTVMKPPDAGFMMVFGPRKKGVKGGCGSGDGSESEEVCVCACVCEKCSIVIFYVFFL